MSSCFAILEITISVMIIFVCSFANDLIVLSPRRIVTTDENCGTGKGDLRVSVVHIKEKKKLISLSIISIYFISCESYQNAFHPLDRAYVDF